MKQNISLNWKKNMQFEAEVDGHKLIVDAPEAAGGQNTGPRPKPLLLVSLAGCTAMDIVSILKKMKVEIEDLQIHVEGDVTEEHPKKFTDMHIIFEFKGNNLPMEKLQKAVNLSEEKYCGISATLKDSVKITTEIKIV